MKFLALIIALTGITALQTGCSTSPYKETAGQPEHSGKLESSNTSAAIRTKLMEQYHEWRGTPYRYGGLSKHGTDCSGFIYLTYRHKFGIKLPRTTKKLAATGMEISQRQLQSGDLVFFNTGLSKQHVGIYLGKRKFLHASTSRGVMISNMDNVYWRDKYWQSRRY